MSKKPDIEARGLVWSGLLLVVFMVVLYVANIEWDITLPDIIVLVMR